jgi:hypothetical protein
MPWIKAGASVDQYINRQYCTNRSEPALGATLVCIPTSSDPLKPVTWFGNHETKMADTGGHWLAEAVVDFLRGPMYIHPLMAFIDEK